MLGCGAKTGVSTERRYIALEWVTASLAALTYAFCVWLAIYFAIMMLGARHLALFYLATVHRPLCPVFPGCAALEMCPPQPRMAC